MPTKETVYHMAADIYASGHTTIKQAAEYAVKLADLVDQELAGKNKVTPECFKSEPSSQTRKENGCIDCKHNDACFEDKRQVLAKK